MKRTHPAFLMPAMAWCLCASLSACSSKPTAEDGRAAVENQIRQSSHGLIHLVDFKKTNGEVGEVLGVRAYEMAYQADIEFLGDAWWAGKGYEALLSGGM